MWEQLNLGTEAVLVEPKGSVIRDICDPLQSLVGASLYGDIQDKYKGELVEIWLNPLCGLDPIDRGLAGYCSSYVIALTEGFDEGAEANAAYAAG